MPGWKEDPTPAAPEPLNTKPCPYCAETIKAGATKCRFCGEWLERRCQVCGTPVRGEWAQAGLCAEHIVKRGAVTVPTGVGLREPGQPLWSPGVAGVLSFMIPGLGQIYKGRILSGLAWMMLTAFGYVLLIVPGLITHFFCILSAASGDPTKRGG